MNTDCDCNELGAILQRVAAVRHGQGKEVAIFLPTESAALYNNDAILPGIHMYSATNVAKATELAGKTDWALWVFGPASPVAFKLYPLRTLSDRLKIWELVRSDNGFWAQARNIPSMPLVLYRGIGLYDGSLTYLFTSQTGAQRHG